METSLEHEFRTSVANLDFKIETLRQEMRALHFSALAERRREELDAALRTQARQLAVVFFGALIVIASLMHLLF